MQRQFRPIVLLLVALGGCGEAAPTLRTAERIPLPDSSFTTLAVDSAGIFWIGRPGAVLRLNSSGADSRVVPLGGDGTPRWIGSIDRVPYFEVGERLAAIPAGGGEPIMVSSGAMDAAELDVAGRYLFTTSGPGTVVAYRASSLQPVWGWAAVGAEAEALAMSPEGDRIYQPVGAFEYRERPELLVRDLQTGEILRRIPTEQTVRRLVASRSGDLFGAMWNDEGVGSLFALAWSEGDLDFRWRRSLDDLDLDPPLDLKIDPLGRSIAVRSTNEEAGLHLVEVETGLTTDRGSGAALDFAFDPRGSLWLLYPGELRRAE